MGTPAQSVASRRRFSSVRFFAGIAALALACALPASAQYLGGPPSTNMVGGHFLAPAPSVTSIGGFGPHMPPPLPSVTSIPNYGYHYPHYNNGYGHGYGHGRNGYGYGYGYAYAVPYYYVPDTSAYGYDYVGGGGGGPDLYGGPPPGANDPTLHIIAEQPPSQPYPNDMSEAQVQPALPPQPPPDVKPGEPTLLVFRDGKHQSVTNYAIMGDDLYVFDQGRKKIALADLDIPATVKANDDRGVEFRLPPEAKKKVNTTATPQSATPEQKSDNPPNVAAVMP